MLSTVLRSFHSCSYLYLDFVLMICWPEQSRREGLLEVEGGMIVHTTILCGIAPNVLAFEFGSGSPDLHMTRSVRVDTNCGSRPR